MINIIWFLFIFLGIIFSILTGNAQTINNEIINSSKEAFDLIIKMMPVMVLWMGLLNIAEKSGLLIKFSNLLAPILHIIFPKLDKKSKALTYISSNIAANMIGLGSAATPFGLKAMNELQKDNLKKDTATTEMITFLVLNTSGVTLIPTTVIALRTSYQSLNPTCIILTSLIATFCSSTAGLLLDYFIRRKHE